MRFIPLLVSLCFLPGALPAQNPAAAPKGHLIAVGGGKTGVEIVKLALKLGGGNKAQVVIIPEGSAMLDPGVQSVGFWRQHGARRVTSINDLSAASARKEIASASIIWMPGGSQIRLMEALQRNKLVDLIRSRYQDGAVIGGTSAGAAVMSQMMMLGGEPVLSITTGKVPVADGLGLWPEVIVDQHFLKRQRFARLFTVIIDHPDKIGVGIDEETAILVSEGKWTVLGKSSVIIVDARMAKAGGGGKPGTAANINDMLVHVLSAGATWVP